MNGLWYCPAYCLKSKSVREFRADRVIKIIATDNLPDERLRLPDTIHGYLDQIASGSDCHIIIELTDIGVKSCETEFLLAKGLQVFDTGGRIDMSISRSTLDWLADYLLLLGKHATILEPAELKEMVRTKIDGLHTHYYK